MMITIISASSTPGPLLKKPSLLCGPSQPPCPRPWTNWENATVPTANVWPYRNWCRKTHRVLSRAQGLLVEEMGWEVVVFCKRAELHICCTLYRSFAIVVIRKKNRNLPLIYIYIYVFWQFQVFPWFQKWSDGEVGWTIAFSSCIVTKEVNSKHSSYAKNR